LSFAQADLGSSRFPATRSATFHIEGEYNPKPTDDSWQTHIYLVSIRDPHQQRRLPAQRVAGGSGDGSDSDHIMVGGDFFISPDERWIFRTQKAGTGTCLGYLYERHGKTGSLDYQPATSVRFDLRAWRFLARMNGIPESALPDGLPDNANNLIIDFVRWSKDSTLLLFSLRGDLATAGRGVFDWQCYYNTAERRFDLTQRLRQHNQKTRAVTPLPPHPHPHE
jgi:hypothetical protein